jgi:DNA mismatch endonuclease (patch repair protein)
MDTVSRAMRSAIMASVRGRENLSTELRMMVLWRTTGITGWRRGSKLTGKPDFVFPKLRLAVFVDGCFWHGCPKHGRSPKQNAPFWRKKISRNMERDREVNHALRKLGWRVARIWEHEFSRKNEPKLIRRLLKHLSGARKRENGYDTR